MFAKFLQLPHDVLGLIYPAACLICAQSPTSPRTHLLCEKCLETLASQPVPPAMALAQISASHQLDAIYAGWPFDEWLQAVIHAYKYRYRPSLSQALGAMLALRLQNELTQEIPQALLVPVPLHRRRGRERGFNQSELLAQALAVAWKMEILPRALKRTRFTQQQATLTAIERQKNVAGAFAVNDTSHLQNRTILLVDDVFTTGATMNACAATLKAAGVTRVVGIVLAKA